MDERRQGGSGVILSIPADKTGIGGWKTHKPGCKCRPCTARRRSEEAGSEPTGLAVATPAEPSRGVAQTQSAGVIVVGAPKFDQRRIISEYVSVISAFPDLSQKEVAEKMGMSTRTLNVAIKAAVREGWLKFEDPLETLKHDIIPHATRNLQHLMKKKDKFATLETMKNTVFKDYQATHGTTDNPQTVLAIKIEGLKPEGNVKVISGQVLGRPRNDD